MNRIDAFFAKDRKAFVPYITAGHPSVDETLTIMKLLVENGGDILELGFPFSDPTADGPVIQASSQQALEAGFRRSDYFDIIRRFRADDNETPIVAFTYFNPVFHLETEVFVAQLAAAGGDAMLVVDLPLEEQQELLPVLQEHGLYLIQLIAPTTPDERAAEILKTAGGFVYQIALKGVTGERTSLADDALVNVARTKALTELPVCMGFGVSNGEMAGAVAAAAEGVVVGSALVRCITDNQPDYRDAFVKLTRELAQATHQAQETPDGSKREL